MIAHLGEKAATLDEKHETFAQRTDNMIAEILDCMGSNPTVTEDTAREIAEEVMEANAVTSSTETSSTRRSLTRSTTCSTTSTTTSPKTT